MKPALQRCRTACSAVLVLFLLTFAGISATAEPLSLKRAVELALAHSPASAEATADEQRAFASYHEARNQYIPQVVVGSGLGGVVGISAGSRGVGPFTV